MKCSSCGRKNTPGSNFCKGCGQPLAQAIPASQAALAAQRQSTETGKQRKRIALLCAVWAVVGITLLALLLNWARNGAIDTDAAMQENKTASDSKETDSAQKDTSSNKDNSESQAKPTAWSSWSDTLPDGITDARYQIETQTLYRTRKQETTTSTSDTLDGWELSSSQPENTGFGAWSSWSEDQPDQTEDREIETQLRYRYRSRESTSSDSADLNGWTQYDVSLAWGDYNAWSDWSTGYVSPSENRKVETKTQYRYRTISYSTGYTSWGDWSDWEDTAVSANDLTDVETRTAHGYCWFQCYNCGAHMHGWGFTCPKWAGGCGKAMLQESSWDELWSPYPPESLDFKDWYGTGHYYAYIDDTLVFRWDYGYPGPKTRSSYPETNYDSWSDWSDTEYSSSDTREVESRTLYRYCDRSQQPTYYFYRWSDWSDWSANPVSTTDEREVESATFYRYRDREYETQYSFVRWTNWSGWSPNAVRPSETVEVEQKTQYRYREK